MITWIIILFFGWLFVGWEFFLYVFVLTIIFLILMSVFPKWFDV